MQKLSVSDASEKLGITKEAIYNRIRRGTLKSTNENGEKFILLEETITANKQTQKTIKVRKLVQTNDKYVELLVSQVAELKDTNIKLNNDKNRLIYEKEQILIEQRDSVERIYKERDEQLKSILSLANRTLLSANMQNSSPIFEASFKENIHEEIFNNEFNEENNQDWKDLKTFLKAKGFSKSKNAK